MTSRTAFAVLLLVLCSASAALAVPNYNIVPLGFDDLEHTRDDGYKYVFNSILNEAGQVGGTSDRFDGGSIPLGSSAWLYDGATTTNIGIIGPEHIRNDGYKRSLTTGLNESGQVIGWSDRYNNEDSWGKSAWVYDGATTVEIGLTEGEHTGSDGSKFSDAFQLNEAGQVAGTSVRYQGTSTSFGRSSWFYDGATTIKIGLVGSEHTASNGRRVSFTQQLNEVGQVTGRSYRYNGNTQLGESAWLHNGAATIDIGLTGSEHTQSDGFKYSFAVELNEAGHVVGYSERFNGALQSGRTAWLYDGTTTFDIGLTGIVHTRSNGTRFSDSTQLNEAGQVIGDSIRFNAGSGDWGQSAWLYDGVTTIEIGLADSEHTRSDGYRLSDTHILNEAGQVIGRSTRFSGNINLGFSSWFYDGATTVKIGLTGSEYTRNDGLMTVTTAGLNEAGQVVGRSNRYNGSSTYLGQDAWFYDPVLDQTFSLNLSTRSDGYAYSQAYYLGDDGLTLGTYTLFDGLDIDLGPRAFYFTIADGLHDLGPLVDGGLAVNGWDHLAEAVRANGFGQILGYGKLTSQSGGRMPYLLSPIIPEPSALLLAVLGTMGLLARRRL